MPKRTRREAQLDIEDELEALVFGPLKKLQLDEPKKPDRASLLGMPPEIRNKIYRLVLIGDERITIHKGRAWCRARDYTHLVLARDSQFPGLLHTNSQIYHETRNIYVHENTFRIAAAHFRPHFPLDISHHWLAELGDRLQIYYLGDLDRWMRLKGWLRKIHRLRQNPGVSKVLAPGYGAGAHTVHDRPSNRDKLTVVTKAREIVDNMLRNPWAEVERALEAYKQGTAAAGYQWV